jgi:hypothetical protein
MIEPVTEAWRSCLGRAPGNLTVAILSVVALLAASVARGGTLAARASAAALCLGAAVALVWRRSHEAGVWSDRRRTLRRVLMPTDRALASRVLRALGLVEEAERGTLVGSAELAHWQLDRVLGRASLEAVRRAAMRRARKLGWLTAAVLGVLLLGLLPGPFRLIEGFDVLLATGGRAPVPLRWLGSVRVTAQPPAYLRRPARAYLPGDEAELPIGSVVTVTGVPIRPGRLLVLTDGAVEVPFLGDGHGGVVARYQLERNAELSVAARFGEVLIRQPEPLALKSRADDPPAVELGGAPRTVKLGDIERLELHYRATDDHGIKQVDLVLRAGVREERRVLGRLDGESNSQSGAHALRAGDAFLQRAVVPVTVTIEVKDNDAVRGPKWGQSAAITVIPSVVGEPEAARLDALVRARNAAVDLLAWRLDPEHQGRETAERAGRAASLLREGVARVHSGLGVPAGLGGFLRGQARVIDTLPRFAANGTRRLENAILAVDVAVRGLGERDARGVALRLGELGEEVAEAAQVARETERRTAGLERMRSALGALARGMEQLVRLGELGADLGSVARADLGRIESARQRDDLWHVELAARHLAARLRRPNPSFTTAWRGGVEAGGVGDLDTRKASEADQRFDELMRELAEVGREHASGLDSLERALSAGEESSLGDALRAEAQQRAEALRELAEHLPPAGEDSSTARGTAGIARQQVEGMADELARLALGHAMEDGRAALGSLEQAGRRSPFDELDRETLRRVEGRVRQDLGWIEQRLLELEHQSAARMRSSLDPAARREQELGQRAGSLAERTHDAEAALPDEAIRDLTRAADLMRDAAGELREGRGDRGLRLGHSAQELLDRLNMGRTTDTGSGEPGPPQHDQGARAARAPAGGGYVPGRASDAAQGFRRRVLEGLGEAESGRLGPAVERYAEGLLR